MRIARVILVLARERCQSLVRRRLLASACEPEGLPLPAELDLAGVVLEEATLTKSRLLPYVRLVVNLIEGLQLGLQEVLQRLRRNLRQHRMGWRKKGRLRWG